MQNSNHAFLVVPGKENDNCHNFIYKIDMVSQTRIIHMTIYIPLAYKLIICIICFKNPKHLYLKIFCMHRHSSVHLMVQIIFEVHTRMYHDDHSRERNADGKRDILFQVTKIKSNWPLHSMNLSFQFGAFCTHIFSWVYLAIAKLNGGPLPHLLIGPI